MALLGLLCAAAHASGQLNVHCDVVVAGGSTASLAAAITAATAAPNATICLTDPTDWYVFVMRTETCVYVRDMIESCVGLSNACMGLVGYVCVCGLDREL